jgi:plastocyanin
MSSPDRDRADVGSVRLGACGDHSIHDGESRDLPAEASAKVGDTIVWINKDIFVHTATARNGDWDVTMPPKSTVILVLKKAGLIDYYCRFIRT